jgi:hypothetical protein
MMHRNAGTKKKRGKVTKAQRHKAEKPFSSIPLALCAFVPVFICPFVP